MSKEKVNTHFHSTALIAYITFSENVAGLYQTMMYLMMKMFNLEVVRNTFLFTLFSLSCSLIYNMGITISDKTQMLLKIKLLVIAT